MTELRCRPNYHPEAGEVGVELVIDGQPFARLTAGQATALGAELIRMAAYSEAEAQLDLGYEMLGNDLDKRVLLNAMFKQARRAYFGDERVRDGRGPTEGNGTVSGRPDPVVEPGLDGGVPEGAYGEADEER